MLYCIHALYHCVMCIVLADAENILAREPVSNIIAFTVERNVRL